MDIVGRSYMLIISRNLRVNPKQSIKVNNSYVLFSQTLISLSSRGYVHLWDMNNCQVVGPF